MALKGNELQTNLLMKNLSFDMSWLIYVEIAVSVLVLLAGLY